MTTTVSHALMIDGQLIAPGDEAWLSLDDGLVRGDGVFEGLRLYGRRPRTPEAHLERLAKSAATVGLEADLDELRAELADFCQSTASEDCGVRLMVTRGGQRIWREEPLPVPPATGLTLRPTPHRVTPLLIGAKTLSYAANMQAMRLAKAAGCNDALLVRADDDVVLEGPTTSFAWIERGVLMFPPLDVGILDSLTRRIAVEALETGERTATLGELASAEGAFLLSTLLEAAPVAEIAGVARYDVTSERVLAIQVAISKATKRSLEATATA